MPKPKGRSKTREKRSQIAQLEKHPHGNEKGVKWKMSLKNGSSEKWGARQDTGLRGKESDPRVKTVQRLLDRDKNLSAYGLKAQNANNALQITGIVDTLKEKEYLQSLLARKGIRHFEDGVSISTDGQVRDEHVALEVREELEADPALRGTAISVECVRGMVFLSGKVESRPQEERAIAAAKKARGVTEVISNLNHLPGMDEDAVFPSRVRNDRNR